ncbi:unnamed protein product [Lymnaea stagnalis]|uniref:LTD domain-containing protein n=1 Tax=Lymnaea stagnalis TaxID=6523 RepID=A0AAV2H3E1_LYMST
MDTRSRKRRRGDRTYREQDDREDQVNFHQDTSAVLPDYQASTSCSPGEASLVTGRCSPSMPPLVTGRCSPSMPPLVTGIISPSPLPRQCNSSPKVSHVRSPSPARMFRQREQSELKLLNERLSFHSEHMKQLQAENMRLKMQIEAMDGVIKRESTNIRVLHGEEIKALQNLLDRCIEEKCQVDMECGKFKAEVASLQQQLKNRDVDMTSIQKRLEAYQTMSRSHTELKSQFDAVRAALKGSEENARRLEDELLKERRTNMRLVEESTYNKDRYLKEVEEASGRFSQHMQKADERLEEGYETFVAEELASVREQHIRELNMLREELTTTYQHKIVEWKTKCETAQADLIVFKRETKTSRLGHDQLKDAITQLKADKASLEVQLQECRDRLEELKESSERERCQAQREVALLAQELSEVKDELDEISGANTRLESEINAYRHIVDGLEEQAPPKHRPSHKTSRSQGELEEKPTREINERTKRTNEFNQGIGVLDVDPDGKYVTLVNNTDHPIDLCLWSVQQANGAGQTVKYEIKSKQLLDPGVKLTLWSSDVGHHVTGMDDGDSGSDVKSDVDISDKGYSNLHVTMLETCWLKLDTLIAVRVEDGDGQLQARCQVNAVKDQNVAKLNPPHGYLRGWRTRFEDPATSSAPTLLPELHPQPVIRGAARFPGTAVNRRRDGIQDKDGCRVM